MDSAHSRGGHGKWTTFFAMIATSVVTMFVLTYFNSWAIDHDFFSQTRMWMALMMGARLVPPCCRRPATARASGSSQSRTRKPSSMPQ